MAVFSTLKKIYLQSNICDTNVYMYEQITFNFSSTRERLTNFNGGPLVLFSSNFQLFLYRK